MQVKLIALTDLTAADMACWRRLAATAIEPNPFFEPEYALPLARALGQEEEVELLVVADGEEWRAMLPVHRPSRWHRIPLPALATWKGHHLYGLLGTPLVAAESPAESLAALLTGMREADPAVAFAALEWISENGALAAAVGDPFAALDGPAPILFERFERAALLRRPEPTYVEETLSSKHRRELRRQRRKLGEALAAEPQTVDRSGDSGAYEDFIALEKAGRRDPDQELLADDPAHAAFFTEMCGEFAALGRLQLLELHAGDQTLAAKVNLIAGDTIFCFKIAYAKEWASLSPGIQLEVDMLKLFHEQTDAGIIDSCAASNNTMINRLWPDRRALATQVLPAPGLKGRATRPALKTAQSVRARILDRRNDDPGT